jgi:WD40 repeat protein
MPRVRLVFALVILLVIGALSASAQLAQVYTSNEGQHNLQLWNPNTNELTTLYNIGASPDDMTVNSQGQLIYSVPDSGTVSLWDPTTGTNSVLATGIEYVRDLEIEPSGETMLIAKYDSPAEIDRYTFATGTWTTLVPKTKGYNTFDGIAYDGYGNLYAVCTHNTIIQINPTTGATIATLVLEPHSGVNGGDGLTWDPYTQSLWATHDGKTGIGLLQIYVNKSGFVSTTSSGFTFYPFNAKTTGVTNVDGLKSDGAGNLYIGAIWNIIVYNIPTGEITKSVVAKGADGIGLVPGTYGAAAARKTH